MPAHKPLPLVAALLAVISGELEHLFPDGHLHRTRAPGPPDPLPGPQVGLRNLLIHGASRAWAPGADLGVRLPGDEVQLAAQFRYVGSCEDSRLAAIIVRLWHAIPPRRIARIFRNWTGCAAWPFCWSSSITF